MPTLTIALLLGLLAAAPPPQVAKPTKPAKLARPICQRATQPASTLGTRPNRARKLSEMPPARQIKTVIRIFSGDGCDTPLIVRENIGGD